MRFLRSALVALLVVASIPDFSSGAESVAGPVTIAVQVVGELPAGTVVATPAQDVTSPQRQALSAAGRAELDLTPGRWRLEVEAPGYWSEHQTIDVARDPEPLALRVLPAAQVVGTLSLPRGESTPSELRPEFRMVRPSPSHHGIEQGSATCSVDEDRKFECVLPAGLVDIGLRAPSFATRWVWDQTLRRGADVDLGEIELRRGASVSGWVEVAEGRGDPQDAVLRLESVILPGAESPSDAKDRKLQQLETRPNQRGHFAFEGVPPGSYTLLVELEGCAPLRRDGIPVALDSESVIREPLELFRSRDLTVHIEPPLDPQRRPWTLYLHTFENPDAKPLSAETNEGAASLSSVAPGRYSVLLHDGDGTRRWWREMEIEPGQDELAIYVESHSVRGRVLFGDRGIPAELLFGGAHGVVKIPVRTDDDGSFSVELPRDGSWRVDVLAEAVQGTKWVRVEERDSGSTRVEIVFPDNELTGRVLDTAGVAVEGASVILFGAGEVRLEQSATDGSFRFRGAAEGEAVLAARLEPDLGSDERRVQVRASGAIDGGELILLDRLRLSGAVESTTGGVPGAMVLALAEDATGDLRVVPEQTFSGREGFFELSAPASASRLRVAVLAAGFPLQVFAVPADPGIPVILPVGDEDGGDLVLRPGLSESSSAPGSLLVFHQGFPFDAGMLGLWARRNGASSSERELRVPQLAAGIYTVCTDIEPRNFLRTFASGSTSFGDCRRVTVREDDTSVLDLQLADGE